MLLMVHSDTFLLRFWPIRPSLAVSADVAGLGVDPLNESDLGFEGVTSRESIFTSTHP